jgi:hypothetical protein
MPAMEDSGMRNPEAKPVTGNKTIIAIATCRKMMLLNTDPPLALVLVDLNQMCLIERIRSYISRTHTALDLRIGNLGAQ